jgi:hypothetical protein
MADVSGQARPVVALLWCFKRHGWRLGRVRIASRFARNGETILLAYQQRHVPEHCFWRPATQALHFAALACP